MPDKIAEIIQEYADNPDDYDLKKVVAEIRQIALTEDFEDYTGWLNKLNKCTYCGYIGPDVLKYYAKVGGSNELIFTRHCSDIDACQKRKGEGVK